METRLVEKVIGRDSDNNILLIERIIEIKYLYICLKCPGSPGMVPINGIKIEALQALWYCAKTQGMGILQAILKTSLTLREAKDLLIEQTYFDYLFGRVMKVDLEGDEFDPCLYDRDNGPDAAADAVAQIRLHPADERHRDYEFHIWAEEKPKETKCPRCGA